jgi:hypothetical protein
VKGFVNQTSILGGLVGQNEFSGTISRSYSQVTVSGNSANAGGLVGKNDAIVTESFATGAVASAFASGGLVGLNGSNGVITKSFATGQATKTGEAFGVAGGLVGINIGLVDQTYATGRASGGTSGGNGGLIGDNGSIGISFGGLTGVTTNSYWNTQTSGQSTSAGGVGLTTSQLSAAPPTGFSNSVWGITPGVTYSYLLWQPASTRPVAGGNPTPTPSPTPNPNAELSSTLTHDLNYTANLGVTINATVSGSTPQSVRAANPQLAIIGIELRRRNNLAFQAVFNNEVVREQLAELVLKLEVTAAGSATPIGNAAAQVTDILLKLKTAWETNEDFKEGHYWMAAGDFTTLLLGILADTIGSGAPVLSYWYDISVIAGAAADVYLTTFIRG